MCFDNYCKPNHPDTRLFLGGLSLGDLTTTYIEQSTAHRFQYSGTRRFSFTYI